MKTGESVFPASLGAATPGRQWPGHTDVPNCARSTKTGKLNSCGEAGQSVAGEFERHSA